MVSFWTAYLLGGLTFPLILCGLIFAIAYYTFPDVHGEFLEEPDLRHKHDDDKVFVDQSELPKSIKRSTKTEPDVAAGYFAVTREYVPGGINGRPPERSSPGTATPPESPSVYQSMYRSIFDRKASVTPSVSNNSKGKNVFFVVMRYVLMEQFFSFRAGGM